MSDLVISFFDLILMMVKQPEAKRTIAWKLRYFDKQVASIDPMSELHEDAMLMEQELALCQRRRRSRRRWYNLSNIDEVFGCYYIHQSPATLGMAWNLFHSGKYRTEVYS